MRRPDGDHSPWSDVLIFLADDGTGREITPERRVSWCVAFHRALVARIGDGAPVLVTGRYHEGLTRPANRLAIQYVPASVLAQSVVETEIDVPGAFLVMLPSDVSDDDEGVVLRALVGMTRLNYRRDEAPARNAASVVPDAGGCAGGDSPARGLDLRGRDPPVPRIRLARSLRCCSQRHPGLPLIGGPGT